MSDLLEQNLRDIFSERAAQIDPAASARLRAIDYRPRWRRRPALPALGALGVSATAAAVVAVATLASSAAPAFGRIGAGVTSVRIDRNDGSSIQATVSGGWGLARARGPCRRPRRM